MNTSPIRRQVRHLSWQAWTWWILALILYIISTVGLVSGLKSGLEMGVADIDGVTLAVGAAAFLAFMIGICINLIETLMIIDYKHTSIFERLMTGGLLILDFLALFIALGGHTNIIWLIQNPTNTAGNVVHFLGLAVQLVAAFLGAFFAEYALKRALEESGVELNLHEDHADQHHAARSTPSTRDGTYRRVAPHSVSSRPGSGTAVPVLAHDQSGLKPGEVRLRYPDGHFEIKPRHS